MPSIKRKSRSAHEGDDEDMEIIHRRGKELVAIDNGGANASDDDDDDLSSDSDDEHVGTGRKAMLMKKLQDMMEEHGVEEDGEEMDDEEEDIEGDEEEEIEDEEEEEVESTKPIKEFKNKQRVLIVSSRGINFRHRHLLQDLEALLPHSKKESKLDSKHKLFSINELAELNNCNNCLYFEARRHTDLYLWASKTPNGPSCKFYVQNIHTMDELKMTGNHLKGSRPIVSFGKEFEDHPCGPLMRELLMQIFGVPRTSRKIKPFHDHILSFSLIDDKIWFRNYQITKPAPNGVSVGPITEDGTANTITVDTKKSKSKKQQQQQKSSSSSLPTDLTLVEVGPRFVLTPIRVFDGSFCGSTLWENPEYVSTTEQRRVAKRMRSTKYNARVTAKNDMELKKEANVLEPSPLDDVFA